MLESRATPHPSVQVLVVWPSSVAWVAGDGVPLLEVGSWVQGNRMCERGYGEKVGGGGGRGSETWGRRVRARREGERGGQG